MEQKIITEKIKSPEVTRFSLSPSCSPASSMYAMCFTIYIDRRARTLSHNGYRLTPTATRV